MTIRAWIKGLGAVRRGRGQKKVRASMDTGCAATGISDEMMMIYDGRGGTRKPVDDDMRGEPLLCLCAARKASEGEGRKGVGV